MASRLSTDQVNYLNIGLMFVAAIAAFIKPFETFLFAYAFLGPLHYLTEISWLHDRHYFCKEKHDPLFLLGAGVIITLAHFRLIPNLPDDTAAVITCIAFMSALIFVLTSNTTVRIGLIAVAAVSSKLLSAVPVFESIFGVFLPTLIHVFIFTGLFILVGALKGRSLSGLLSLLAFAVISLGVVYLPLQHPDYQIGEYVTNNYGYLKDDGNWTEGFAGLNYQIMAAFNLHDFGYPAISFSQFVTGVNDFIYHDPLARSLMSFIAFAYFYHYLNWFSKTSVIKWHNISRARLLAVTILWAVSLAIYAYDYTAGLKTLYFLSLTHVLLEFPLNNLALLYIGNEMGVMFHSGKIARQPAR